MLSGPPGITYQKSEKIQVVESGQNYIIMLMSFRHYLEIEMFP